MTMTHSALILFTTSKTHNLYNKILVIEYTSMPQYNKCFQQRQFPYTFIDIMPR